MGEIMAPDQLSRLKDFRLIVRSGRNLSARVIGISQGVADVMVPPPRTGGHANIVPETATHVALIAEPAGHGDFCQAERRIAQQGLSSLNSLAQHPPVRWLSDRSPK